jgi:hypothetical protein
MYDFSIFSNIFVQNQDKYKIKIFIKLKSVNRNIVTRHSEDIVTVERTHLTAHV